ncbi:MAG TPA: ABC transporter ATP-binding protein [Gammaproteobacteria bacterium]|nr:ABC transporter ATP-binding protein [Gammaproteobacteria bacterium]
MEGEAALDGRIRLTAITKAYGEHVVLDGIDLSISRGEFLVLIGRSGSGKSTLLKLVGALDAPDSGVIEFGPLRLDEMGERERSAFRRRRMGFVFQFFNLIPTLTAAENIELPLALNGLAKSEIERRTASLLEELGLAGCGGRFPEELSGGEQQRVAIARAVAHEPEIVLADEPTGNLDLETAERVLQLLDSTCRKRGATLVMATHGREVIGLADRVLTIRNGKLEETR